MSTSVPPLLQNYQQVLRMPAVCSVPSHRFLRVLAGAVMLTLCATMAAVAYAAPPVGNPDDDIDEISSPVVQQVPGEGSMKLNAALGRLGRDPRDVVALIDAGKAALEMGDVEAAVGFYQRANTLSPGNPKVKAGLAGAYVRNGDPFTAIPLFVEAEAAGPIEPMLLSERGLAYDLVGDNQAAQRYYRQVLAVGANDETTRRLALSLAIYGDRRGMEITLAPLLQRQDKAAWRARAFSFAILGLVDEAEAITRSIMPTDLAAAISPYLRYMPRLTPAQQAAAATSGHFPRAAEIGLDDPRVAVYAKPRRTLAAADRALVPAGQPLGREGKLRNSRSDRSKPPAQAVAPARTAPLQQLVLTREAIKVPVQLAVNTAKPPIATAPVTALPTTTPAPQNPAFRTLDPVAPKPVEAVPGISSFDLAQASPAPAPVRAVPITVPPVVVPVSAPKPRKLADVFADLGTPSREAVPAAGAVDIRRIAPSRPAVDPKDLPICKPGGAASKVASGKTGVGKAAVSKAPVNCKPATPPPPSYPSRIWVQLATGRDTRALDFDWRKMMREEAEALRSRKGFTSAWGQTNRLLTGPFESEAAASAFMTQLRRAGVTGSFMWISPAGQVVDALTRK